MRRPRVPLGKPLVVAIVLVALVVTAVVAFRAGAAGRPAATAPRPAASPSASAPPTVGDIYQTLLPSVVAITSHLSGGKSAGGTGVVVNADGTIMTALHVVKDSQSIEIAYADGSTSPATIASSVPASDIATLTPQTLPSVVVPATIGGGVAVGDQVVAIGNQLALADTTTTGVVSGLERAVSTDEAGDLKGLIQFDAAVNPGSSGGPLVNMRGQTVGIVVALANPTDAKTFIGIGFAVPIGSAVGGGRPPQL
ncbi:S1C family serine protease [Hamadaea tsunoensis]|uniref:S1C family serine protease n=1 Tax=Hamadaea tsunoensis TaxID=53368 RepID=UPI000413D8DE|nr:trypsin-like peptidase domain-containing protein [Hamadaea tsunoensis]